MRSSRCPPTRSGGRGAGTARPRGSPPSSARAGSSPSATCSSGAPGSAQRGLALAERRRNVRAAFRAVASAPARVVLVDDVYTSGSTAAAAASALRGAGATRVEVVTFARAVR